MQNPKRQANQRRQSYHNSSTSTIIVLSYIPLIFQTQNSTMYFVKAISALVLLANAVSSFAPACRSSFGVSQSALTMSAVAEEAATSSSGKTIDNIRCVYSISN